MSEYNDKMELTVKFCADKNFLISDAYDKYLLQEYIAKGIQGAFKLIGSDCNNFTEVYLRTVEQTLAFDNVVPVVRCCECKFWNRERISVEGFARCNTGESGVRYRTKNDFCSRGKKREEK